MPAYQVRFARTTHLTANVEAANEKEALEKAQAVLPEFTANEAGVSSFGKWSADTEGWVPVDKFHKPYSAKKHGKAVEEVGA